jgi:hypothetical protein
MKYLFKQYNKDYNFQNYIRLGSLGKIVEEHRYFQIARVCRSKVVNAFSS